MPDPAFAQTSGAPGSVADAAPPPALALDGVDKRFGPVVANRAVSFTVAARTIHGLIGENGAGKTTLMSIAYGLLRPDRGTVRVHGRGLEAAAPRDAIAAGIGMVHQRLMLIEPFTAVESLLLGAEGGVRLGGAARARAFLATLAERHELEIPPDTPVCALPLGLRQRLEIARALYRGADLLILDEPTAVLSPVERDGLFRLLASLRADGRTIVLISHKLGEIMAITDAVTVMRAGHVVATRPTAETDAAELAALMVGERRPITGIGADARAVAPSSPQPGAPPRLAVDGLTVTDDQGRVRLDRCTLEVGRGEIVGIAAVSGNGETELLEALAGVRPYASGRIEIGGVYVIECAGPGRLDPAALARAGVAYAPEDRDRTGLIGSFSARDNLILGRHGRPPAARRGWLDRRAIAAGAAAVFAAHGITPADPGLPASAFSGGNRQKLVLARLFAAAPRLALVGQPTRGVDLAAAAAIHEALRALAAGGAGVLLVSADLDELGSLADRLVVLAGGRVMADAPTAELIGDPARLGALMAGLGAETRLGRKTGRHGDAA